MKPQGGAFVKVGEETETPADARPPSQGGCLPPECRPRHPCAAIRGSCCSPAHPHQQTLMGEGAGAIWGRLGFSVSAALECGQEEGARSTEDSSAGGLQAWG